MSADQTNKRKSADKHTVSAAKPKRKVTSTKKKTAENLEALIELIDKEDTSAIKPKAKRKTRKSTTAKKVAASKPPATDGGSFMQELARAKADLHKERKARSALEEQASELQRNSQELTTQYETLKTDLKDERETFARQIAALERQRTKLEAANTKLQSQLLDEQSARKDLDKRIAEQSTQFAHERDARATLERQLAASQDEAVTIQEKCDNLQQELANLTKECERFQSGKQVAEAIADERALQIESLQESLATAKNEIAHHDDSIAHANAQLDASNYRVEELESQLAEQQAKSESSRQDLLQLIDSHSAATAALESDASAARSERDQVKTSLTEARTELESLRNECAKLEARVDELQGRYEEAVTSNIGLEAAALTAQQESAAAIDELQLQLATSKEQSADATRLLGQLRKDLTDAKHEKRQATIARDETAASNQRLEARLQQLDAEANAARQELERGTDESNVERQRIERLEGDVAKSRMDLADAYEQLGAARLRLANSDRDRDHAQRREQDALRRANQLEDEVKSQKDLVQREAAARRKAEAVFRREPNNNEAATLFEAEQRIERLTKELAASKSVETAYQQKAARQVQKVSQELETLRARLAEFETPAEDD